MSALTVTLGGDLAGLKTAMSGAVSLVSASAKRMAKISGAGLAGLGGLGGLGKGGAAAALSAGWDVAAMGLKTGIGAALAGGAAAMGVGVKSVSSAANFESTKVAFTTLIGDAAKAEETLAKLRELGAETPFEFPELADAGRKLIAFGEGADTVTDTLRRIGDVSAGIQAPIGEIAEIYGKARVQGRLFAEDVNQLTGRGVPIIGELAKQFGVSQSEVRGLVESGKVGFPQIEKAFVNLTSKGGKFHGMMEEQSKTTKGLFSTLKDAFNEVFMAIGQPINDAIRPMIAQAIGLVGKLAPMAAEAGAKVRDAMSFVITAFKSGQVLELVTASLKLGFATGVNELIKGFRTAVTFLFNLLADGSFWKSLGSILGGVALGFGAALLEAFRSPIVWLQAAFDTIGDQLLDKFLKIPGMETLTGVTRGSLTTSFQGNYGNRQFWADDDLGGSAKAMMDKAGQMISAGMPSMVASVTAAAGKTLASGAGNDMIDTTGLKKTFNDIVASIKADMPKPEEVKAAASTASKTTEQAATLAEAASRIDPIVSSLGKVGGGGYSSGVLDAQKENNRLTERTNGLITDLTKTVEKLTRPGVAKFA